MCVCLCVKRPTFVNSREASSSLEADIGIVVHEIMELMNKVKHRPEGQDYSQWAGEKKKLTVFCAL